jgi:diguanylate cyclase (GGDEF)-like protein
MRATSLTSRLTSHLRPRGWLWWALPPALRFYVVGIPVLSVMVASWEAAHTSWHWMGLGKFVVLACCGMISVASTPRIMYTTGGVTRDFTTVWALPTAILLPPVYASLIPIPLVAVMQLFVHRGVVHRAVFTAASISLSYALASIVFRAFPPSFAGGAIGTGMHALTWVLAVVSCEVIGGRSQHFMIVGAVKLSDRRMRILDLELDREALQGDFEKLDIAVLVTLAVALTPALVIVALPTVLLVRRFLVHPVLVAQSRVDAKTGLLNVATWEREADVELSRSARTRSALSLAIVDIDHFKRVNDTYGHLVGDRVLKAVAAELQGQLRDYDRAGRFGGEEFVLMLAQSDVADAERIAERLRAHIDDLAVPIDDRPDAPCVSVTISIGLAAMARDETYQLTDLLTAADSALYQAKQTGRNRVCIAPAITAGQLVNEIANQMGLVQGDPASTSLCPAMSLSAIVTER